MINYELKENNKKLFIINIIFLICAFSCLICYDILGGLWLKGVTSGWFVMLGFLNVLYVWNHKKTRRSFVFLIELGLFFGMCADILLGVHFIFGILFFAAGHVAYLVAFFMLEKFQKKDILITLPFVVVSLYIVAGTSFIQIEDQILEKMLLGYACIIACMLGKAVSNLISEKSKYRWLILVGSIMFWFSDIVLAIDMFGESSRLTWILCSYVYWPAQNIMAHSMFYINDKK
jgi:uncharacterized membrane protein YhhN